MSSTDDDSSIDSSFSDGGSDLEADDLDEIEQQVEVPKDIELRSQVVGLECHPKKNQIAIGTIDGPVYIYTYGKETGNIEAIAFEHHKKSCRAVKFSSCGQYLFTGSQDTTVEVIDLETSSIYRKFLRPNGSSIYSLLPIDSYLLATGEDEGQVVIWDFRMQSPIALFGDINEYISSLSMSNEKRILLATSGEGTLTAYNVRSKKMAMQSEMFDSEFLSSTVIKNESKVVVGSGDGSLNIFNWGEYGNISDRFPGHPGSVDCMVKIAEDVVCTGCEDGKIRAVQLFPTRFLGVLGSHNGFSIDGLSASFDKTLLASSSFDQKVKFWDLSGIDDMKSEDVKETKKKHSQLNRQVNDFFSDIA
ncbi:WD repeat-containing protein 55-like [Uloborus diversus]|uniref:WD repeat-containing protein 55-like n=1 Tax=Uloborus diversus TaxID=327109 RepID=UPI00240A3F00|nr:WD repeat-containing protein 55-like [Uloborus diversus]